MTRYHPPGGGPWGIDYPQGWHVHESPAQGTVLFFKDDPEEGSAFLLMPYAPIQGEMGARQVLEAIAQSIRQHYPDFQVKVQGVKDLSGSGTTMQLLDAEAVWTGARQQGMRAALVVMSFSTRGTGYTLFVFMGGQAPTAVFNELRPVYVRMMQSFSSP